MLSKQSKDQREQLEVFALSELVPPGRSSSQEDRRSNGLFIYL